MNINTLYHQLSRERESEEAIPDPNALVQMATVNLGEFLSTDDEAKKLDQAISLFAGCAYGLLLPNVDQTRLHEIQELYDNAWMTYSIKSPCALPGVLTAIANYEFFYALPQLAYLFQRHRIRQADFEARWERIFSEAQASSM